MQLPKTFDRKVLPRLGVPKGNFYCCLWLSPLSRVRGCLLFVPRVFYNFLNAAVVKARSNCVCRHRPSVNAAYSSPGRLAQAPLRNLSKLLLLLLLLLLLFSRFKRAASSISIMMQSIMCL
ncbi:unnamed protein product [Polarella glacialis]|uniref:Uncharacterized protein n=1 Tax=Polarella glacialis TaxID=89957 RepID=A0A813D9V2_POLGL|nr:unnamed protein product [Polarella glacialis]